MKKICRLAIAGLCPLCLFVLLINWPGPRREGLIVYVPPESSGRALALSLKQQGIISSPLLFEGWMRLTQQKPRAGEYAISRKATVTELVRLFHKGPFFFRKMTIPEGATSAHVLALLNSEDLLSGTLKDTPPEGSIFPDTYNFLRGEPKAAVLGRMQKTMETQLQVMWLQRQEDPLLKSPGDLLILASIVEKESFQDDRSRVASVFLTRLASNMPLQSDATVFYGASFEPPLPLTKGGKKGDKNPKFRSIFRSKNPYNTYRVRGLPPGPICNPGLEALKAAAEAQTGAELFFVEKPDGKSHAFSKDFGEHRQHVARWALSKQKREQEHP